MSDAWTSTSLPYVVPRDAGRPDAWTEESADHKGSQQLLEVAEASPPHEVASQFGLRDGENAIVRRRLVCLDDTPVELVDSWYPKAIASGTGLAEAKKIRGGAPRLLAELGHRPQRVIEEVGIRSATEEERDQLALAIDESVLTLFRVSLSTDERPMEVSLMTMKGPRRIRYEIEVN